MLYGPNVFDSPDEYLDPRNLPPVPLVKLPARLNRFPPSERVHIYGQLAFQWPLRSLKHPAVFQMLSEASRQGLLDGVHTIVDSSSGNTAFCEAVLAKALGKKVRLFIPGDIPKTKEERLRNLGVAPEKCYDRPHEPSAIQKAQAAGQEAGCYYVGQYSSKWNVDGHERFHIQPAWVQTREGMTVYCCGTGTTGTVNAALQFFRKNAPHVRIVAGMCASEDPVPGLRTRKRLEEVPLAKSILNGESGDLAVVEVRRPQTFQSSWELAEERINAGPSSGTARVALENFLFKTREDPDAWEQLRNKDGDIVAVFMCGDAFDLYDIEKYTTILDPDVIPIR